MEYRRLGQSDLLVSRIGLGGATFGREINETESFAVLDRALERGMTLFDTAAAYSAGRSEEILGRWIAARQVRNQIVLTTKVVPPLGYQRVIASVEASLRRLQVETIDLFLLHSWDATTELSETLATLEALVQAGKIRQVGCSNFDAEQLHTALRQQDEQGWRRMEATQPVYNLAMRAVENGLLDLCAAQQIGVITYSPLGAGFLTGKYHQGGPVPSGTRFDIVPAHQDIYFNDRSFAAMERLRATADALQLPMPLVGLAWVLQRPGVTTTLIGARSPAQVDQAFTAAELVIKVDL